MRSLLRSVVNSDAAIEVAGTASDGMSALQAIGQLQPDLVLIASPRFEADIARDLGWLEAAGIRLVLGSRCGDG